MKNSYFKVRKVVSKMYGELEGIIVPRLVDGKFYTEEIHTFNGRKVNIGGTPIISVEEIEIKNKHLQLEVDRFIQRAKGNFEIQEQILKLNTRLQYGVDKLSELSHNMVLAQDCINEEDLMRELIPEVNIPYYDFELKCDNFNNLIGFSIDRVYDLGRHLHYSEYDFLDENLEYGGCNFSISCSIDLRESEDFKRIATQNSFKSIKLNPISKNTLEETLDCEHGDKDSASIYHRIDFNFASPIKMSNTNLEKIKEKLIIFKSAIA